MATGARDPTSGNRRFCRHPHKHPAKYALFLAAAIALVGAAEGLVPTATAQVFPLDAIGRLIVDDNHRCTAFVIRSSQIPWSPAYGERPTMFENWLATAGHCFGGTMVFQRGREAYTIRRLIGLSTSGPRGLMS